MCFIVILFASTPAHAGGVGIPNKEDIPKYVRMLTSAPSPKDRALAADQIGRRGQLRAGDVKTAMEPLLTAMKSDKNADVRRAAIAALGNIGTQAKTVIPALEAALKDKSLAVNLAAVTALGQYGMQARQAVPALRKFARGKNKDKKIMRTVNMTIKQINAPIR